MNKQKITLAVTGLNLFLKIHLITMPELSCFIRITSTIQDRIITNTTVK